MDNSKYIRALSTYDTLAVEGKIARKLGTHAIQKGTRGINHPRHRNYEPPPFRAMRFTSLEVAANEHKINKWYLSKVRTLRNNAPELYEKVKNDQLSVPTAYKRYKHYNPLKTRAFITRELERGNLFKARTMTDIKRYSDEPGAAEYLHWGYYQSNFDAMLEAHLRREEASKLFSNLL